MNVSSEPPAFDIVARIAERAPELRSAERKVAALILDDIKTARLKPSARRLPLEILTTDVAEGFSEIATRLMLPHAIPTLQVVDIGTA